MFRRSGPVHMLLLTVQNKIVQDRISLSVKFTFKSESETREQILANLLNQLKGQKGFGFPLGLEGCFLLHLISTNPN